MTTVLETLEKALELHKASPWVQRSYEKDCDGVTGYCAAGAVLYSKPDGVSEDLSGKTWPRRGYSFYAALTVLNETVKRLMPETPYIDLIEYNDRFANKKEDITNIFEMTIQEARLRELAKF